MMQYEAMQIDAVVDWLCAKGMTEQPYCRRMISTKYNQTHYEIIKNLPDHILRKESAAILAETIPFRPDDAEKAVLKSVLQQEMQGVEREWCLNGVSAFKRIDMRKRGGIDRAVMAMTGYRAIEFNVKIAAYLHDDGRVFVTPVGSDDIIELGYAGRPELPQHCREWANFQFTGPLLLEIERPVPSAGPSRVSGEFFNVARSGPSKFMIIKTLQTYGYGKDYLSLERDDILIQDQSSTHGVNVFRGWNIEWCDQNVGNCVLKYNPSSSQKQVQVQTQVQPVGEAEYTPQGGSFAVR